MELSLRAVLGKSRRGASGLTYGLSLGLVAIAALSAVGNAGTSLNALFRQVSVEMQDATTRGGSRNTSNDSTNAGGPTNLAPTALALNGQLPGSNGDQLEENTDVSSGLVVASIVVTDDGEGTNVVAIDPASPDAGFFSISGSSLIFTSATPPDFETQSSYSVTVTVDDATVGSTPDQEASFVLLIQDVSEGSESGLSGSAIRMTTSSSAGNNSGYCTFSCSPQFGSATQTAGDPSYALATVLLISGDLYVAVAGDISDEPLELLGISCTRQGTSTAYVDSFAGATIIGRPTYTSIDVPSTNQVFGTNEVWDCSIIEAP